MNFKVILIALIIVLIIWESLSDDSSNIAIKSEDYSNENINKQANSIVKSYHKKHDDRQNIMPKNDLDVNHTKMITGNNETKTNDKNKVDISKLLTSKMITSQKQLTKFEQDDVTIHSVNDFGNEEIGFLDEDDFDDEEKERGDAAWAKIFVRIIDTDLGLGHVVIVTPQHDVTAHGEFQYTDMSELNRN